MRGKINTLMVALGLMACAGMAWADNGSPYTGAWSYPENGGQNMTLEFRQSETGKPYMLAYWQATGADGTDYFLLGMDKDPGDYSTEVEFHYSDGLAMADAGTGTLLFVDGHQAVFDFVPSRWMAENYGMKPMTVPLER